MELKGSKTEQNLWTAFAGESQARVKYGYYASAAKKEGYNQIAAFFEETSVTKKNTLNCGSKHCTVAKFLAPSKI